MAVAAVKRMDKMIANLVQARTILNENDDYEFDIESILGVAETANKAVLTEVLAEEKELKS